MAAALIGRDTWRYGTLAVLIGAGLVLIGIILNRSFLKEALFYRGPARRADPMSVESPHARKPGRPASAMGRSTKCCVSSSTRQGLEPHPGHRGYLFHAAVGDKETLSRLKQTSRTNHFGTCASRQQQRLGGLFSFACQTT